MAKLRLPQRIVYYESSWPEGSILGFWQCGGLRLQYAGILYSRIVFQHIYSMLLKLIAYFDFMR